MAPEIGKVADAFPNDECYSLVDITKELGLGAQRTKQLIDKALKSRKIQNLTKKVGNKILYAPPMVKDFVQLYKEGVITKPRKRNGHASGVAEAVKTRSLKHAELVLTVPIFDKEITNILIKRFGSNDGIAKYVVESLNNFAKPALAQIKELEDRFAQERAAILSKF